MKLKIVETDFKKSVPSNQPTREELRAHYERKWLLKGKSKQTAIEMERIKKTFELLAEFCDPHDKKACDLGCGDGLFTKVLEDNGASVDAVDISQNALKLLFSSSERVRALQDRMPKTKLEDDAYDIVAALDLIAELPQKEHRLFFMEVARLVNKEGFVIVSTPIDFRSENALDLFVDLAKTELDLKGYRLSYHLFLIRILDFFKAPRHFNRGSLDMGYRKFSLENRKGLSRWWFSINSKKWIGYLWGFVAKASDYFLTWIENSQKLQHILEKLSKALRGDHALTHVILIGKRRPLFVQEDFHEDLTEKVKKRMWE